MIDEEPVGMRLGLFDGSPMVSIRDLIAWISIEDWDDFDSAFDAAAWMVQELKMMAMAAQVDLSNDAEP